MNLHPSVLRLMTQLTMLAKWQYFQHVAAILIFTLFFIIGRKSYESKFTHVLNTINDCQNQKKRLTFLLKSRQDSQKYLSKKMIFFKMTTLVIIISMAVYTYLIKFYPLAIIIASLILIVMWLLIFLRKKYLQMMIKSTQTNLQQKMLSSQADAKQIMSLLGEQICKQLKVKFQRELDVQWRSQELKDCDLRKCQEQKSVYRQLYQLYKDIIAQMQKMQWCDTCSQTLNIDANQIKLSQIQNRLNNYNSVCQKLSFQKKKELTNRLLEEWQLLEGKLPFMCRRGCCIRFRHSLEEIKKKYHEKMRSLKSRQSIIKA